MKNVNRATQLSEQPPVVRVGFCINEAGEAELVKSGIPAERIWMRGRGAETLDYALRYYRGRPGTLAIADDLRILGDSRKAIIAQVRTLKAMNIAVHDVVANDNDELRLLERALVAISCSAAMRNHRTARRRGSLGGKAKQVAAAARRNERVEDEIAIRLCASRLTWDEKAEILAMPKSTLQRHYRT